MRKKRLPEGHMAAALAHHVAASLCAGLTFAFLSQVLQYWVIQDAVADSAGYYHAVGALRTENTEAEDAFPSLSVLEKSEYVDYVNTYVSRYGTMQDVFNTDLNGDLNNHILYLQGIFREITEGNRETSLYVRAKIRTQRGCLSDV